MIYSTVMDTQYMISYLRIKVDKLVIAARTVYKRCKVIKVADNKCKSTCTKIRTLDRKLRDDMRTVAHECHDSR